MNQTPYYTAQSVASHLARSYKNILRWNAESGEFQKLHGNWVEIDAVRVEHYVRSAICTLLGHAMNIGEDARNELYSLDNETGYNQIAQLAAQELRYPVIEDTVEEPVEAVEEVRA